MTEYRIVIPILNSQVVGLVGRPWQLSSSAAIETVLDEDHAALLRDPPQNEDAISINAKVINIRAGTTRPTKQEVVRTAAVAQFCLNFFAIDPGLAISWAVTLAPGKKNLATVVESFDFAVTPLATAARRRPFKFDKNTTRDLLIGLHQASTNALTSFPGVMMSVDRFCRALSRDDSHDRLVDLCIALESLLDGSNELRFRFSQLHAVLSEQDLGQRMTAFKLFQTFYDARSKVVHGDPAAPAKVDAVEARWLELLNYSKKSLAYYLAYLSGNNRETWNDHVNKICLGIETPNMGT